MGIYIPNMDKPKGCGKCEVWSLCHYPKVDEGYDDKVMPDCPLIEIDQEDEEAVLFLARMRKGYERGQEFLDGERRSE